MDRELSVDQAVAVWRGGGWSVSADRGRVEMELAQRVVREQRGRRERPAGVCVGNRRPLRCLPQRLPDRRPSDVSAVRRYAPLVAPRVRRRVRLERVAQQRKQPQAPAAKRCAEQGVAVTIKWTMEAAWAAIAVVVTASGGVYTTIYGAGAHSAAIQQVAMHQTAQDKRLDTHDDRLNKADTDAAARTQALADIKEQLNRMEDKLDHQRR